MLNIWFIRHGQSQANAGQKTSDSSGIELSSLGRKQAELVADHFSKAPDLIVSSPYARARQTSECLTRRFPKVPFETWPVQEFTYLAHERCENTTETERVPLAHEYWERYDPHYVDGEAVESYAGFMARVEETWTRLTSDHRDKWVVVFSHAHFIKASIWWWLHPKDRLTPKGMRRYRNFLYSVPIPNGAILKASLGDEFSFGVPLIDHIPEDLRGG